jgi:hypothetical protein
MINPNTYRSDYDFLVGQITQVKDSVRSIENGINDIKRMLDVIKPQYGSPI